MISNYVYCTLAQKKKIYVYCTMSTNNNSKMSVMPECDVFLNCTLHKSKSKTTNNDQTLKQLYNLRPPLIPIFNH